VTSKSSFLFEFFGTHHKMHPVTIRAVKDRMMYLAQEHYMERMHRP